MYNVQLCFYLHDFMQGYIKFPAPYTVYGEDYQVGKSGKEIGKGNEGFGGAIPPFPPPFNIKLRGGGLIGNNIHPCHHGNIIQTGVYIIQIIDIFAPTPFFQNDIFFPYSVKISSFLPFFHLIPLIFAFFLIKSHIFSPTNQFLIFWNEIYTPLNTS